MAKGKVLLTVGYTKFIMEAQAATALFNAIAGTEVELYETKWNAATKTSEPRVMMAPENLITLSMLSPEQYSMGKLLRKADLMEEANTVKGES